MFSEEDKLKYKNQALTERIAEITATYESQIADLRVALTELSIENQGLRASVEEENGDEKSSDANGTD